jgi:hypothetical protein
LVSFLLAITGSRCLHAGGLLARSILWYSAVSVPTVESKHIQSS